MRGATDPAKFETHAHVVGKSMDLAAHAIAEQPAQSGEQALDKLRRELRRTHDKRIFRKRRSAQRTRHQ